MTQELPSDYPSAPPPELIDIGTNLASRQFEADREQVIARALRAGVAHMIVLGTCVETSRAALELARAFPGSLSATAGVHPHDAKDFGPASLPALRELAAQPEVVAIGECGLDFERDYSPRPAQLRALERQLELACELGLPLYLHDREASTPLVERLRAVRPQLGQVVVHCFTGSEAALDAYLELDVHLGITGWVCDERRGDRLRALLGRIPADRLMIETDAPYLLPRSMGKRASRRNEPAFLPWVLETIAQVRAQPLLDLARRTTETARAFFGLR